MKRSAILAAIWLVGTGCSPPVNPEPKQERTVFWLDYHDQAPKPIRVDAPYAMFLSWSEKRFALYAEETFVTADFDRFLDALARLPRGASLLRYDTCCASRIWDMPGDSWNRLEETMRARGLTWAVGPSTGIKVELVCTCEARLRYP